MDANQKKHLAPLLAGISGGGVSTCLLLPLDNVKVRMQVYEGGESGISKKSGGRLGFFRVVRGVIRHEGIGGLYQGLTPAVVGSSIAWGGFFFFYEGTKKQLRKRKIANGKDPVLTPIDNFGLACLSGAVMVGITNPIWLIKLRIQLQMKNAAKHIHSTQEPYKGTLDAARTIVREEGFLALYKGSVPALMMTSHGGVQFVVYEFLRKHFHYQRAQRDNGIPNSSVVERLEKSAGYLTIAAVAKIIASTVTYPLQVLKARMQQRSESVELTSEGDVRIVRREYRGVSKAAGRIWEKEGLSGFFKGCLPNAIRVAPNAAVTFVVYEAVMDFLEQ